MIHSDTFMSFKPYYNWNTFNTEYNADGLLNDIEGFKPYYNWNTFNTNGAKHKNLGYINMF